MSGLTPAETAQLRELRDDHYLMTGGDSEELETLAELAVLHAAIQRLEAHDCRVCTGGGCCLSEAVKVLEVMLEDRR